LTAFQKGKNENNEEFKPTRSKINCQRNHDTSQALVHSAGGDFAAGSGNDGQ